MMKLKNTLLIISLLSCNFLFSQGFAANVGYAYIGKNAGFLGLEYRINDVNKPASNIGIGAYLTTDQSKFALIPEMHYTQIIDKENGLITQLSVSTKNMTPSFGINIWNASQLKLGYSFPFQKDNGFKGINVGLNIFFGQKKFHDQVNWHFM